MDRGLKVALENEKNLTELVSILILMDRGLKVCPELIFLTFDKSFNPYSNGQRT